MYYVSIDHLTEENLNFVGYDVVKEDSEFKVLLHVHTGEDYIIQKSKPFLYVADLNDAVAIRALKVQVVPE